VKWEAEEHEDNLEKKDNLVFQVSQVVLDLWENVVLVDLKDHPEHQEQMLQIMVDQDEMEIQVSPDHLGRLDIQE
jgi:hypothetical protein